MNPHPLAFYVTLFLLVGLAAVILIRQWWAWNEPDARLRRDLRRARRPW